MADVREDAVNSAAEDLKKSGYNVLPVRCDVAVESDAAKMVEKTVKAFGRLDTAYNNAGIQSPVADHRSTMPKSDLDDCSSGE